MYASELDIVSLSANLDTFKNIYDAQVCTFAGATWRMNLEKCANNLERLKMIAPALQAQLQEIVSVKFHTKATGAIFLLLCLPLLTGAIESDNVYNDSGLDVVCPVLDQKRESCFSSSVSRMRSVQQHLPSLLLQGDCAVQPRLPMVCATHCAHDASPIAASP